MIRLMASIPGIRCSGGDGVSSVFSWNMNADNLDRDHFVSFDGLDSFDFNTNGENFRVL